LSEAVQAQNKQVEVRLPDGSAKHFPAGVTGAEIAQAISSGLARNALSIKVNGEVWDLDRPITTDADVAILTWQDPEGKATFWHSSAHILAEAIEYYFPGVKLGIGPPIQDGFYYDIDFGDYELTDADFEKIEQKFMELAKSGETFERVPVSKAEALRFYREEKYDPYKLELIEELEDGTITFYNSGNFTDLCRGPHIPDSRYIKAVKLLSRAGAYWRGDSDRKQLTRIYGISFPKKQELDDYLAFLEEAKKRDHRVIGKQLGLFSFHQEGPGFPFWHHNGMVIFNGLKDWLRQKLVRTYGYEEIQTPMILNEQLWHRSGHWQNYQENMYFTAIDEQAYAVKPMNCPGSTLVFGANQHSYRDLPQRYFEFGLVHRHELSGVLTGLFRVRAFTQDDAHVFCLPQQVNEEVRTLIQLIFEVYGTFGFDEVDVYLATRPEQYMGDEAVWDRSERELQEALTAAGVDWQTNPGDGAFYGPKIDFVVRDALKREWQLGTIQLDFSMPERFDLKYKGSDGQEHRPVMIHRAILGSFERFIGVLLEHTAGKLPLWLAPQQAAILPISDKYINYANSVKAELTAHGFRVAVDERDERISRKIRDAELQKIPYMLVVGEQEAAAQQVNVRAQGEGDIGAMSLSQVREFLQGQIEASYHPAQAAGEAVPSDA
jgi:threonyl-tRNA synthetase